MKDAGLPAGESEEWAGEVIAIESGLNASGRLYQCVAKFLSAMGRV